MKNDLSYVLTKPGSIDLLLKLGGKQKYDIKDVMIIGGGRIGRKTAESLEKQLEQDALSFFRTVEDRFQTLLEMP